VRVAVLSDVHGNLPALEAVLADVEREGFDLVVSAGDVVSGPMPGECLDRLSALGDRIAWVRGNADRLTVAAWDAMSGTVPVDGAAHPSDVYAARLLTRDQRDLLQSFAPTVRLGEWLVCHGTPASDEEIVTQLTPPERLAELLAGVSASVVVGGHVHHQFMTRSGDTLWCNAGSVGRPYEGSAGAFWLALLPEAPVHRRTEYDVDPAIAAISRTGCPGVEEIAQALRGDVTAAEAAAVFEARA
jgi:putative phosphoesterase